MKKATHRKSTPSTQTHLEITPEANDLWKGIGGHFETLCQILCEFIDNSISNLAASNLPNRLITITFGEVATGTISVSLEDNGTGISNLTAALKIGDKSIRETQLNEHGFGLKHALAHANPDNTTWQIATRTQSDYDSNIYHLISAPYAFSQVVKKYNIDQLPWPGYYEGSGTRIYFECTEELFRTLRSGVTGRQTFDGCLECLCEDLGFIYCNHIEDKKVSFKIMSSSTGFIKSADPVKPVWRNDSYEIIDEIIDLEAVQKAG